MSVVGNNDVNEDYVNGHGQSENNYISDNDDDNTLLQTLSLSHSIKY
jgi:hypothetical protein